MVCTTVRKGTECPFMSAKGCSYNGGVCHEVVEQCGGCNKSAEFETRWYCSAFPQPVLKWKSGKCNLATHVAAVATTAKAKVNPIKASKRGKN
ncbi:MAG: PxxKW family cysteine-rich protein [Desulfobacterales bacterium]|nr:PxxKW family cysteine-rich protein [Desulfobacterales bacterium]